MSQQTNLKRRNALKYGLMAIGGAVISTHALAQTTCGLTPPQTEGPFYPVKDQKDKDTDLIWVDGHKNPALGKVVIVQGIVSDELCQPLAGALVEIWQACHSGKYNHSEDPNTAPLDPNFQYWGKAVTDDQGKYQFRTIVPGAYPADVGWIRPPHIHFKVHKLRYVELITQMYFAGEALNEQDLILLKIPAKDRSKVVVPLIDVEGEPYPIANFNLSLQKV